MNKTTGLIKAHGNDCSFYIEKYRIVLRGKEYKYGIAQEIQDLISDEKELKQISITLEHLKNFDLSQTLDCGQCFRWLKLENNVYKGIVNKKVIILVVLLLMMFLPQ